jgi:ribosome maturation factor RimP
MEDKTGSSALKEILKKIVESAGVECVWIDLKDAKSAGVLKIYIDLPGGIRHEECERVSKAVAEYFDSCEGEGRPWFKDKYFIEVSSPGIERPLFTPEHYRRFAGRRVQVKIGARKKIEGKLLSCDDAENIAIQDDDGTIIQAAFREIKNGKLIYVFEKGVKRAGKPREGQKLRKKRES